MGITLGRWTFQSPTLREAATVEAVAAQLRQTTGLGVRVEGRSLVFEALGAWLTLYPDGSALQVEGGIPPHPYLWEHLDAVLNALGTERETTDPVLWIPDPANAWLRQPWRALPWWARWPLRLHGIAGLSPLEGVKSVRRVFRLPPSW